MKRLAFVVVLAALAWSGFWFWSAQALRSEIEAWFDDRRAEGWEADYTDLFIRGFPNRLDATFIDLALADPDAGLAWRAPFFQVLQLVYRRGHAILIFPDTQTVVIDDDIYAVQADGMRASVNLGEGDTVQRAGFEADVLNIDGPDNDLALAGLAAGLAAVDQDAQVYRVGISADAAAGGVAGGAADGLALQATIGFDQPWTREALEIGRPQPVSLDLSGAEYRKGALFLRLAGDLDIDEAGRATGDLALRAENWRDLLDAAVEAERIPEAMARTLEQGLGLVAQLSGNPETLDLPLRFDDGMVRIGPIPMGEAPRLRLP
ncbi:DUF2125 domain-containing protein [Citreimonas salinaria]|uniref:DUF2125 domain-containing protein n=1 Tax=Citreimonas salinaria TaxID=321339 RepID=A0A1H3KDV5_9RHOB|nr:DUF2125 domain-containing protein [Citreimonas salinaria]SDY50296.1 hypothetical protein SAMN05444340_10977 [Citreimonas salinaria]